MRLSLQSFTPEFVLPYIPMALGSSLDATIFSEVAIKLPCFALHPMLFVALANKVQMQQAATSSHEPGHVPKWSVARIAAPLEYLVNAGRIVHALRSKSERPQVGSV